MYHVGFLGTGLMAQVSFRSGLPEYNDRFELVNALNLESYIYSTQSVFGAWYSDDPIALAYTTFLPNRFSNMDMIRKVIVWVMIDRLNFILSGEAKQTVDEHR